MKSCQACGHSNSDDMSFCLECGKPLPDAPMVFNLGTGSSQPGGQQPSQFGGPPSFGNQGFQQQPFSMVPPSKSKGSGKKIWIAVGGFFALILLIFLGVGGIVAYNYLVKPEEPIAKKSPSPEASPSVSPSSSAATPKKAQEVSTPKIDESVESEPRASSSEITAEFNVKQGGRLGMRVKTTFTVYNLKGEELYLALYFQDEDGNPLKTTNTKFSTTEGDVAAFFSLKPGFDEAFYDKVEVFMPYDELKLSKGKYTLNIDASVIYKAGGLVDHLDNYPFEYEKF